MPAMPRLIIHISGRKKGTNQRQMILKVRLIRANHSLFKLVVMKPIPIDGCDLNFSTSYDPNQLLQISSCHTLLVFLSHCLASVQTKYIRLPSLLYTSSLVKVSPISMETAIVILFTIFHQGLFSAKLWNADLTLKLTNIIIPIPKLQKRVS